MKRKSFFLALLLATATVASGGVGESAFVFAAQANQAIKDYQNHVHKADIEYAVKNQLMWLFPDGNFRPDQTITQADLVVGLVQVKGLKEGVAIKDFPVGHWAKTYYERAVKDGILKDVAVEPNKVLTREEAAFLVINAWESVRKSRTRKDSELFKNHSYIQYTVSSGWIVPKTGHFPNGVLTNKFDSKTLVTRGDAASSLRKLHEDYIGIQDAEIIFNQFHQSLTLSKGVLTGFIPNNGKYSLNINFYGQKVQDYEKVGKFSLNISNYSEMIIRIVRKGEAVPLVYNQYANLPEDLKYKSIRW